MPHYVALDLSLHCLPMTLYGCPGKNGLNTLGVLHSTKGGGVGWGGGYSEP